MLVISVVICALVILLLYIFPIIEVVGDSMYPTYKDGEFNVSVRVVSRKQMKLGDVYIFKSPTGRTCIKRLTRVRQQGKSEFYFFEGDNSEVSWDSRKYGYVRFKDVKARLINSRRNANWR